ncbi:MAG: hypothetical protein K2Y28_18035 [Burkholderiaceae bacterium]|nr:hypothetical protein [Burkholderiaceae bacterium]
MLVVATAGFCFSYFFPQSDLKALAIADASVKTKTIQPLTKEMYSEKIRSKAAIVDADKTTVAFEFSTSKNLRAFIETARQSATRGGYPYIFEALKQCEYLSKGEPKYDAKEDSLVYSRRLEVAKFWVTRCQNLLTAELDSLGRNRLDVEGESKKDSSYELEAEIHKLEVKSDRARLRATVRKWLAAADPWLLESQGLYIMAVDSGRDSIEIWFEGKQYPSSELSNIQQAWYLVPCAFGYVCDQNDFRLAVACIDQSYCYVNRFDYVRSTRPDDRPNDYQTIYSYYQRIVAAIQRQDVDAFVKPDGVP